MIGQIERAPELSPPEENRRRVAEIIETEKATWQAAVDAGEGSPLHNEAEVARLTEMGGRVDFLVGVAYEVAEPVDSIFVHDVMDFLQATDYSRAVWPEEIITRESETHYIEEAVESLRQRNAGLAEAA